MKKLLLTCLLLTIFLVITIGATAAPPVDFYIWNAGTTREGTNNYVLIGILAETINNYAGDKIFMSPIPYTKSLVGLKGFDQGECVSMYASAQQYEQLINKEGPFSPETYEWSAPYTQMMWTADEDYFFLIREEDADEIKNWHDLANRPIFPHMRGTGSYELIKTMLGPDGIDIWDTVDEKAFEISHAADALKLNQVDAIFCSSRGGVVVGWGQEVLSRTNCILLAPTPEEAEMIVEGVGFLKTTMVSNEDFVTGMGITGTVPLITKGYVYLIDPDVPDEIVYTAVKTAFENAGEMAQGTAQWRKFAEDPLKYNVAYLEKYHKMGQTVHPGTLRYLEELGYDTKKLEQ